jgi:hypothetical protein
MNTTAQVKQAIKKSGQQIRQEPLELLRAARQQVTGAENEGGTESYNSAPDADQQKRQEEAVLKQKVASDDQRHLEALQNEIRDISRQKMFNDLIQRIQNGEDVPVEEFQELSHEQREVLKAHKEAAQKRKLEQQNQSTTLQEPVAKRNRRMGGQKQAAQKQTTRVEKPQPPSG